MTPQNSEFNIQFHVKIIYTFLVINVSFCTLCLYLLIHKEADKNCDITLSGGKYNLSAELIQQRNKRDSTYYQASPGIVQQCTNLLNVCRSQTSSNHKPYDVRTKRQIDLRGPPGPPGPPGETGSPGLNGTKGDKGERGHHGLLGFPGFKGEKGPKGTRGDKGERGTVGPTGLKGSMGSPGPRGLHGKTGPPGDIGQKGNNGLPGLRGYQGFPGPKGPQGSKGQKGETGYLKPFTQGGYCKCTQEKGEKGSRGQLGFTGYKGDKGDRGQKGECDNVGGFLGSIGHSDGKGTNKDTGEKEDTAQILLDDSETLTRNRKFLQVPKSEDRKLTSSPYTDSSNQQNSHNSAAYDSTVTASCLAVLIISFHIINGHS